MRDKIVDVLEVKYGMPKDLCPYAADETLELFSRFIMDEEDKFIAENNPHTHYNTGVLSGLERLLYALQEEQ